MIETEQTVVIDAAIGDVWNYVSDIQRWAALMPGMRECAVADANDSRWTLKVGVGGLVRTVKVDVHVDEWDGPGRVLFSYKLDGDPVQGGGTYTAKAVGESRTEIVLNVRVEGGGPMAPMWEAMGKPLLPQLAKGFAGQLKAEIEAVNAPAAGHVPAAAPSGFFARLRNLWRALFGRGRA
ncbi:MAG: SRPBCC family protein [Novosphingobium sp.]|jgi:carbon monoxide dehydrogenase subunit G|nr:SRPBCC family protein [Novosphingobium sp.]